MKSTSFLLAAAAAFAAAFAVSCSEKPSDDPKEPEFVFNSLSITGSDLQIMDRNVGAKDVEDPGNYYQFGKNTPVANGKDATLNDNFDPDWSLESAGIADWSVPENTPCPEGWRMMNADDIKALKTVMDNNSMAYEYDMCSKEQYEACKAMVASMGLIPTGKFLVGKDGLQLKDAAYSWTAVSNAGTAGLATLFESYNDPTFNKNSAPSIAVPIRCVK